MKPSETKDLYARLGINSSASEEEIKNAYKQMALRYHPDRNPNNRKEATREFIAVSEAFEVLSDPVKRARYDSRRKFETEISVENFGGIFEYFNEMFKKKFEEGTDILPNGTIVKREKIMTPYGIAVGISVVKKESFVYSDEGKVKIENNSQVPEENTVKESKKSGLEKLIEKSFLSPKPTIALNICR